MSRSKHAVELCALLVDETYGELASRIFTVLLRRGRLSLSAISKHTLLSRYQLRHGMVVLVQQGLVYYNTESSTGITQYEANADAAYGLIRSGKIMDIIETKFGSAARDVVQNLFLLGSTRISDLTDAYESKRSLQGNGHTNGDAPIDGEKYQEKSEISTGQLHSILERLLESGYVELVIEGMSRSPTDIYNEIERELLQTHFAGSTKGAKQKEELKVKVQARLRDLRESRAWKVKGKKRPLNGAVNGANGASKRIKLSNGNVATNGDHILDEDETRLDPNLVVRINYAKCTVILRNQALVAFARDRIGENTSRIYAEGLRLLEDKIARCQLDPMIDETTDPGDGPTFTSTEIEAVIGKAFNVSLGIGKMDFTRSPESRVKSKKQRTDEGGDVSMDDGEPEEEHQLNGIENDEEGDPFDDDLPVPSTRTRVTFEDKLPTPQSSAPDSRGDRVEHIKKHLQLLAAEDCKFVRKCGTRGLGEWTVDFEGIIHAMQEAELDAMLLENFGTPGHRLARIMRKFGKMDEKQLPNMALLKQKDVRTKLAEMQMAGIVDIQEVPRDSNRTPSRTMYLWFFDTERVSTILLDSIYKNISRCYERLNIEKRRANEVLSCTERSDVRDLDPAEYLEPAQLNELQEIRRREDSLLGHIGRLDGLVGIFRDF